MNLRRARPDEAPLLASIAYAAKAMWGYSPAQLALWAGELGPDAQSIANHPTWIAESDGAAAGFCQLRIDGPSAQLEHLWIAPLYMRQGFGAQLLEHARGVAAMAGVREMRVDSDPNAEAFYLAQGWRRAGATPAPVEGDPGRVLPLLVLVVDAARE